MCCNFYSYIPSKKTQAVPTKYHIFAIIYKKICHIKLSSETSNNSMFPVGSGIICSIVMKKMF